MFLTVEELPTYYATATNMEAADVTKFLGRANAYAMGVIGGVLPSTAYSDDRLPIVGVKNAVALAFEIFSKGQTGASDPLTGNITEIGPTGLYVRQPDPLKTVDAMLKPYAEEYDRRNASKAENGMRFL